MKRILVPIDFSVQAERAIEAAAQIANYIGAHIYLLHMVDLPANETDMDDHGDASGPAKMLFLRKIHERFEEMMNSKILDGLTVHEEIRFHKTFSGIIDYSKELKIDLIVMGSQGATGIKEMFIGSNTEKVVRHSDVPVLVVKKGMKKTGLTKFVFASNFSDEIKPAFGRFLEFASLFGANVHLLFVNTIHNFESTKKTSKRLREFVEGFDMPEYTLNIFNDTTIEQGILNFSKDLDADLIALNTHQRSGLSSMFNESISEDLVNHALKPVITFKI